jgi:protein-S-isoprenylcysteine O-methyltransferase Ste14
VEKYVLPLLYAFLAYRRFRYIESQILVYHMLGSRPGMPSYSPGLHFADMTKQVLLFALMAFTGITLLFNRPPASLPDKLKHVIVPLAVSYYVVLYGSVDYWPAWLRVSLMPAAWRYRSAVLGLGLSIIGYSIAIWALVYLRRSFALFVSVREVVVKGPYRYVRHPMYLGYLLDLAGLLLTTCSAGMILLGAGFVVLMVCRARLEEEKLGETSPLYQQYFARTGFLFPRFRTG